MVWRNDGREYQADILSEAWQNHPFRRIVELYDRHASLDSEKVLDDLLIDLYESPELARLRRDLAEGPAYTSVFRYDPNSLAAHPGNGCFAGPVSSGAVESYLRIFKDLTPDKLQLHRLPEEVVLLIDHPSTLIAPNGEVHASTEPTVLLSSRLFSARSVGLWDAHATPGLEEELVGMSMKHGDALLDVEPPRALMPSAIGGGYVQRVLQEMVSEQGVSK